MNIPTIPVQLARLMPELPVVVNPAALGIPGRQGIPGPVGPPGSTPTSYAISNVSSFNTAHAYPYPPTARLLDEFGQEVDTDVTHNPGQISLAFAIPFTGTLYLS